MPQYRMPAEWEPHKAIWLAWPHNEITFPNNIQKIASDVAQIILAIHHSEQVELLVLNEAMENAAKEKLESLGVDLAKVTFRQINYMDGWMRDVGPIFVKDENNETHLVKWIFNQTENNSVALLPDDVIPYKVKEWLNLKMEQPELALAGGAIDVNGQGLCLTTEQCLLNENNNLGKTKQDIEKYLADFLGVKKTIWLFKGLYNDHTHGHIDEIARFIAPNKILCAYEDNEQDENYTILKNNYETLVKETTLDGQPLEVIKLPLPHITYKEKTAGSISDKAAASYTNFYIGNTVVLAPIFGDPNDATAAAIIQSCFPDKKVVTINCRDIIEGGGAIHCMTQQEPT